MFIDAFVGLYVIDIRLVFLMFGNLSLICSVFFVYYINVGLFSMFSFYLYFLNFDLIIFSSNVFYRLWILFRSVGS